ncbi:hypothetical protein ACFRIC_09245 [Streptomyces sp. NPDC056738]|uniref:hypothetical protein n=1 Tax=Streptomyces sp. NPDC056738 TaxID=3345933 RepID=UPI0036747961
MKPILFGALSSTLLFVLAALSLTAETLSSIAQPTVLTFVLGVLARPAIARRARRWLT